MEAITVNGVQVGDVVSPQIGSLFYVDQACYQASREADQGRIANAYRDVQSARSYAYKIEDASQIETANAKIAATNDYVASKEPAAAANLTVTAASDDTATKQAAAIGADPTVQERARDDAADAQAAQDAIAAGNDPNTAYNKAVVSRTIQRDVPEVVAKSVGVVSGAGEKIVSQALGPWKYLIAGVLVVGAVLVGAYLYTYVRVAKAAGGAVT